MSLLSLLLPLVFEIFLFVLRKFLDSLPNLSPYRILRPEEQDASVEFDLEEYERLLHKEDAKIDDKYRWKY